jgi:U3 small nucleolar RNA-associated protein 23
MRNKEHYILATAEPLPLDSTSQDKNESNNPKKRKRAEAIQEEMNQKARALRAGARSVPGVPIIYVKRSVMILEPLSLSSDRVRLGVEKSKFKTGVEAALSVISGIKRKREDEDDEEQPAKERGLKKAKAPNPLSMKKPKKREKQRPQHQGSHEDRNMLSEGRLLDGNLGDGETTTNVKTKRKRRHKSAKVGAEGNAETDAPGPAQ